MIGQGLGLQYLMPLALEELARRPLAAGDFYPGDLLQAVLGAPSGFWKAHPELCEKAGRVAERGLSSCEDERIRKTLQEALAAFQSR